MIPSTRFRALRAKRAADGDTKREQCQQDSVSDQQAPRGRNDCYSGKIRCRVIMTGLGAGLYGDPDAQNFHREAQAAMSAG